MRFLYLACFMSLFGFVVSNDEYIDELAEMTMDELLDIEVTVASNVVTDYRKQPVSITTITRRQIEMSGARTLSEVIMTYVPGYFVVEDQDDVIAGFRGFSPDNNSKVLMLLNGHNVNTEWFWGPSDGILNGIGMDHIEQIQVIRGPGSVTQGQGALLGVINVITRKAERTGVSLHAGSGAEGYGSGGVSGAFINDQLDAWFYVGRTNFDGQEMRDEGWAHDRFDQGLTVFQRDHGLKRTDNTTFFGAVDYKGLTLNLLRGEQNRDLYNFFRDREEVTQTLTSLALSYRRELSRKTRFNLKASYAEDDYQLLSHEGFVMGGTREYRKGLIGLLNWDDLFEGNRLALGFEVKRFQSGRADASGNNFIINAESSRLDDVNATHRWVFPKDTDLFSLMLENFYSPNDKLDLFAAFRYDDQTDWGQKLTPRLGAIYAPNERWRFRLAWQTGFRGAVGVHYAGGFEQDGLLREENFSRVEENATLFANGDRNQPPTQPEEMSSVEFAADYRINERLAWNSVLFFNTMKNVIDVSVFFVGEALVGQHVGTDLAGDWGGFWFFKNNEGEIRQWGLESSLQYSANGLNATLSHALVRVDSAGMGQFGGSMYIAGTPDDPHFKAYPENVSRLNLLWSGSRRLALSYNHLYYYQWYSPRNNEIDANHIASGAVQVQVLDGLKLNLQVKNLWDQDKLYPMNNNAGNESFTDGTPALEGRTWWLTGEYRF